VCYLYSFIISMCYLICCFHSLFSCATSFVVFIHYFHVLLHFLWHHIRHYNVLLTWLMNSSMIAKLTSSRKLNSQLTHVVVCFCQAYTHQRKRYICMFVSMYYCFSIFRLTDLFVIFSLQNLFRFGNKNVDQGHWLFNISTWIQLPFILVPILK
jgi:hypothetical protein